MIDEIDKQIILQLQEDGRQSYIELAKKINVTEGTARKRLKRLKGEDIVEIVAVPNCQRLGYEFVCIIAIQVDMAHLNDVAERLSQKHPVCQVSFVTGRYDLFVTVVVHSAEQFSKFIREEVSVIPYIVRTETFVVLSMVKGSVSLPDTKQLVRDTEVNP